MCFFLGIQKNVEEKTKQTKGREGEEQKTGINMSSYVCEYDGSVWEMYDYRIPFPPLHSEGYPSLLFLHLNTIGDRKESRNGEVEEWRNSEVEILDIVEAVCHGMSYSMCHEKD